MGPVLFFVINVAFNILRLYWPRRFTHHPVTTSRHTIASHNATEEERQLNYTDIPAAPELMYGGRD